MGPMLTKPNLSPQNVHRKLFNFQQFKHQQC
eukprot:CAMPEP_0184743416 /NCGR_PEP_ID=MMETSP0315-20130426/6301_1 /TAXON_ID=101924 /ORGANISM="Rhodosorus marinus, Strain UTEX LB 2760" /LENGTH=30 /DNA_ID= /DNA_START= /DNA_END= /DNA_ORIENTATION=